MYARTVKGKELDFGVSGSLWRDALVMYDRETESFWTQISGRAIMGPMKGNTLEHVPSIQTTWGEWRRSHPETLVLKQPETVDNDYQKYDDDQERLGIFGTENPDQRLDGKSLVLGIRSGPHQVAYPLQTLEKRPILNHQVGPTPVLVLLDASEDGGRAFSRLVGGQELTFRAGEGDRSEQIRDRETGSAWNPTTGEAVAGKLQGTRLDPVISLRAYWFAWRGFFPETGIWKPE